MALSHLGGIRLLRTPRPPGPSWAAHGNYDLVCFSHLRWDFVYQRPQHLLSRFARTRRVFFIEEPLALSADEAHLELTQRADGLTVAVPRLPAGISACQADELQASLVEELFAAAGIRRFVLWYYTPMALGATGGLPPALAIVYDCMDELSAFRGAPPELVLREAELFQRADLVFTGGQSLYEAKRRQHPTTHLFPSSVDVAHFARSRTPQVEPADQAGIPRPRLGFFGVLDERFDADLVAAVADLRPDWHVVLLGPVAKIEAGSLPRRPNIYYLGAKAYADLPVYLAGWDVAMIPFARNAATRFVSPTKTPEYLAAGRPVVSTSIRDVVRPYGEQGLVRIADEPIAFVAAAEAAMAEDAAERLARADACLATTSWDRTWSAMARLIDGVVERRLRMGVPSACLASAVGD
jgi:UDP-galactopyranose mutase